MNIEQEIRVQIEKNKGLKLTVGEINNNLSILEGLLRNERYDAQKQVDEAYQRGLHEGNDIGYKDGVNDGQNEAWEAAKKLFSSMAESDIEKAFPIEWNSGGFKALMNLQPQEAIERLKAYEEKQKAEDEIKVGDIVERYIDGKFDSKGIYLNDADEKGAYWNCLFWTGACFVTLGYPKNQFKKTDRHFDIDKILEEMKHD